MIECPAILRADILVTFTREAPYLLNFNKMDLPPLVRDHASLLQVARYVRDTRAAYSHHLGQELLRQREVCPCQIVHAQQPLAGAHLDTVKGIAGGGLLGLGEKKLIIFKKNASQPRLGFCGPDEMRVVNDGSDAGNLRYNLV